MHKTTTLKGFNVFLLKTCLMTLLLGLSFSVSFAQKQATNSAKPVSDEKRKQMQAASNANASAAFSDAVNSGSAVKANPSAVNTPSASVPTTNAVVTVETRKARMKAANTNSTSDLKPAPTEKTAAQIAAKKSGQSQNQNNAASADRFLKAKGN